MGLLVMLTTVWSFLTGKELFLSIFTTTSATSVENCRQNSPPATRPPPVPLAIPPPPKTLANYRAAPVRVSQGPCWGQLVIRETFFAGSKGRDVTDGLIAVMECERRVVRSACGAASCGQSFDAGVAWRGAVGWGGEEESKKRNRI